MSRSWLRLFAWVGLTAFLAADPHAVAAATALLAPARCACHPARSGPSAPAPADPDDTPAPDCKHCRCAQQARPGAPEVAQAAPEQGKCPCGRPSCPGCPKGPSCPVPGGCAYCNVAKVPCLPALLSGPSPALTASYASSEAAPLYASPFSGQPCRPPKA